MKEIKKKSVNIYLIVLDVELKKYLIDTKKKKKVK